MINKLSLSSLRIVFRIENIFKNLLIFLPLLLSERIATTDDLLILGSGFLIFSIMTSICYSTNDYTDKKKDIINKLKVNKIVLDKNIIIFLNFFLFLFLIYLYQFTHLFNFYLVVYLFSFYFYNFFVKSFFLIDIIFLTSFYIIRIFYGSELIDLDISYWFLFFFISFFLIFSIFKRMIQIYVNNLKSKKNKIINYSFNDYPFLKKIVIFAPGAAFGPSKMWPVNKFKELLKRLDQNYKILILGSKSEVNLGDQIADGGKAINLCGKTSIQDAVDLMHISEFCVSNDSGLMHLASATKTKSISIYGATSPDLTPPLTTNKEIHYRRVSCSPCFEKKCKYGHYNCLVEIQADDVFKSFK